MGDWILSMKHAKRVLRNSLGIGMLTLSAATCFANVRLSLEAAGDTGAFPWPSFDGSEDIEIERSVSDGGSLAYGYANLDTGILRAYASSSVGARVPTSGAAVIEESFSFTGQISGRAYLDWSFDGAFTLNSDKLFHGISFGVMIFNVILPGGSAQQQVHVLASSRCDLFADFTSCLEGDSVATHGSIELPVVEGEYFLEVPVLASAIPGETANFANRARLFLRTPENVE